MDKKNIEFDDTSMKEYEFYQDKSPFLINYIDTKKAVASNKILFDKQDFKYLIIYKDPKTIKTLCIFRPRMRMYKRDFYKTNVCIF